MTDVSNGDKMAEKHDADFKYGFSDGDSSHVDIVDRQRGIVLIEHMRRAFGANKLNLCIFLVCINCELPN